MNEHPQSETLFDEYALGVIEGEELHALRAHLQMCEECSRKAEQARARITLIGLASPPATPSPAVRQRLLESVRPLARRPEVLPVRVASRPWVVPALAVAAVALACLTGFLLIRNQQLSLRLESLESSQTQVRAIEQRQQATAKRSRAVLDLLSSHSTIKVSLAAVKARPVPQGKAFYSPEKGLVFYATNLPHLPIDRTYQLWLLPKSGKPISAGIFETDKAGNGQILLPPLPRGIPAKAFAVTVEPEGGRPQPTGKMVLLGAAS
ncbi:MAG TPA: anti-sigma factor [Terriglobia bacterium]|nr:anti-sigma factor [Terriglobia bacterium]